MSMLNPQAISWLAAAALISACAQSTAPTAPAQVTSKQEAAAALQRQDYVTAERLYRSLAEQGDASAQHFLGKMYESGEGMRRNPVEAAKWFRLAADQGHTGAQFYLGGMYASGNGVPRDYVQAYMWFDLSSEGSQEFFAAASRSAVADKMTSAQIAEAQKLASAWRLKRPDQR
jgi:TPR repeat protein